jgi:catalase
MVQGKLVREKISRTNDFKQAGERWRKFEAWERDELISNLVCNLKMCKKDIQERIIANLKQADAEYAQRVIDGLANAKQMMEAKPEMAKPAAAKV